MFLARFLAQEGATVLAVSDSSGGVYNSNGIDVETAIAHKQETGALDGLKDAEKISDEELLLLECDVLAPCALEQVITTENADKIKARIICEGANGPTTPAADEILEDKGVLLLPDVLANAGGVVVSYFEWVQGLQEYFWKEDEVNARLNDIRRARSTRPGRRARRAGRACGWPRTGSRCSGSRKPRRRAGYTRTLVRLYRRVGCHLCELARETVASLREELGFELEEVAIDGDPELEARYRELIPVVEIDGERAFVYFVPPDALRRKLAQTRS